MQRRVALFSTTLILALLSGSNAMGYYGGGVVTVPSGTAAATTTTVLGTVYATVGPSQVITLKKKSGLVVTKLRPGTWKIIVDDKSAVHNFHLTGQGVAKTTTVSQITKVTWTVTFVALKTYTYVCDPHKAFMRGSFTIKAAI